MGQPAVVSPLAFSAESRATLRSAIVGALAGLTTWLVYRFLERFMLQPLLCGEAGGWCDVSQPAAFALALVLVTAASVGVLVRQAVYRPLLAVIAVVAALWGLQQTLSGLAWYEAAAWLAVCMAAGYGLFAWLARYASFGVAVAAMATAVVAARLVLVF